MPLMSTVAILLKYRYLILFPLACFEGPILAFVVGTLIAAGFFNPIVAYAVLIVGDVAPDVSYYLLGRFGAKRNFVQKIISRAGLSETHLKTITHLWHTHTAKTMFFT